MFPEGEISPEPERKQKIPKEWEILAEEYAREKRERRKQYGPAR